MAACLAASSCSWRVITSSLRCSFSLAVFSSSCSSCSALNRHQLKSRLHRTPCRWKHTSAPCIPPGHLLAQAQQGACLLLEQASNCPRRKQCRPINCHIPVSCAGRLTSSHTGELQVRTLSLSMAWVQRVVSSPASLARDSCPPSTALSSEHRSSTCLTVACMQQLCEASSGGPGRHEW